MEDHYALVVTIGLTRRRHPQQDRDCLRSNDRPREE
jgi:hypothetical protein